MSCIMQVSPAFEVIMSKNKRQLCWRETRVDCIDSMSFGGPAIWPSTIVWNEKSLNGGKNIKSDSCAHKKNWKNPGVCSALDIFRILLWIELVILIAKMICGARRVKKTWDALQRTDIRLAICTQLYSDYVAVFTSRNSNRNTISEWKSRSPSTIVVVADHSFRNYLIHHRPMEINFIISGSRQIDNSQIFARTGKHYDAACIEVRNRNA